MNARYFRTAAVLLLCSGALTPAQTPDPRLPAPREVIQRYVDAIGGEAMVRKPKSMTMAGTFSMPAAGLEGTFRLLSMAPDRQLQSVTLPGVGEIREGFDGRYGWAINPMTGPMLFDGAMLRQARFRADFYAPLHDPARYRTMETAGRVKFGELDTYELRLVTSEGDEIVEYFAVDSGLLVGFETTAETAMGPQTIRNSVHDYKDFSGLRLPTRIEQELGPGMTQTVTFTSITRDDVDPASFALPPEIRALAEGGTAATPAAAPRAN